MNLEKGLMKIPGRDSKLKYPTFGHALVEDLEVTFLKIDLILRNDVLQLKSWNYGQFSIRAPATKVRFLI